MRDSDSPALFLFNRMRKTVLYFKSFFFDQSSVVLLMMICFNMVIVACHFALLVLALAYFLIRTACGIGAKVLSIVVPSYAETGAATGQRTSVSVMIEGQGDANVPNNVKEPNIP